MKRLLLRPQMLVVGIVGTALIGWGAAGAVSAASAGHRVTLQQASTHVEREAQKPEPAQPAEPEVQNQAPAQAPVNEPADEQEQENEAAEDVEEANEAPEAEDQNEPADNAAPPAPAPAPAPTTSSQTFTLVGGSVTFTCTNNQISITSVTPAAGFRLDESEAEDNGQQAKVRFESDSHRSEIEATCAAGQVQATEIREESEDH